MGPNRVVLTTAPIFFVASIALAILTRWARPARSAFGTAMCDQVRGFRDYLSTIEANQLKVEENFDIFSAYLPWAAAFGITDKWVSTFASLEKSGQWTPGPLWIPLTADGLSHDFTSPFSTMSHSMSSSMSSAASPSWGDTSSSDSGFSSSSSDSGFGGGGGGSW